MNEASMSVSVIREADTDFSRPLGNIIDSWFLSGFLAFSCIILTASTPELLGYGSRQPDRAGIGCSGLQLSQDIGTKLVYERKCWYTWHLSCGSYALAPHF